MPSESPDEFFTLEIIEQLRTSTENFKASLSEWKCMLASEREYPGSSGLVMLEQEIRAMEGLRFDLLKFPMLFFKESGPERARDALLSVTMSQNPHLIWAKLLAKLHRAAEIASEGDSLDSFSRTQKGLYLSAECLKAIEANLAVMKEICALQASHPESVSQPTELDILFSNLFLSPLNQQPRGGAEEAPPPNEASQDQEEQMFSGLRKGFLG